MAIRELRVSGYRSLRQIRIGLKRLNLLTGPVGCGKSNLYRALLLMRATATGGFARAIASDGGMPSVLWAGVRKRFGHQPEPQRVKLAIRTEAVGYEVECGLPEDAPASGDLELDSLTPRASQFLLDPEVKLELVRKGSVPMLERNGLLASARSAGQRMAPFSQSLNPSEAALSQIREPHLYPELAALREEIERWRFYHRFHLEPGSPPRRARTGVLTPVLSQDGSDLAAALQTVIEIGDAAALREAVDRAFPGARLEVLTEAARFRVALHVPGVVRPLEASELSDGVLRYLCLTAALLSPRPPELLALDEPEAGIHPDLVPPLAGLIARASQRSQLWITTHSRALADQVQEQGGEAPMELRLVDGETRLV